MGDLNDFKEKKNNTGGVAKNTHGLMRRRYVILAICAAAVAFIVYAGIAYYSSDVVTTAQPLEAAVVISRYDDIPGNRYLPLHHVSSISLSSEQKTSNLISKVDAAFDPRVEFHGTEMLAISTTEARAILKLFPSTSVDSDTFTDVEIHSTNMEVDDKYYFVQITIPKSQVQ